MSQTNCKQDHSWLDGRVVYRYCADVSRSEAAAYYRNGTPQFLYPHLDGCMHGVCRIWHDNGNLSSEVTYHRGVLNGLCREWYPSGVLKLQVFYFRGLKDGMQTVFDESGRVSKKQFFVRGSKAPEDINELVCSGKISARDIIQIGNVELRRACLTEFGYAKFLAQMKHEVIAREGEYELVRINWRKGEEPICLVKVKCPTTGAFYTLRVPPTMKTVKEAVAWTFGMASDQYSPAQEA